MKILEKKSNLTIQKGKVSMIIRMLLKETLLPSFYYIEIQYTDNFALNLNTHVNNFYFLFLFSRYYFY